MTVQVYSGWVLIDEFYFEDADLAIEFASVRQDEGFKVRVSVDL
jgi:hypothetical protein